MNNFLNKMTSAIKSAWPSTASLRSTKALANPSTIKPIIVLSLIGAMAYNVIKHPPVEQIAHGHVGIRTSWFNEQGELLTTGSALLVPGFHQLRVFDMRDQSYTPFEMQSATGSAPVQSVEGLSLGLDVHVRYALNKTNIKSMANKLPDSVGKDVVEPAVQGLIYKIAAKYTVREIFSTKRAAIQQELELALKPRLAADGIDLKSVQVGKIDLPADYKRGMEAMLAEEMASEKMRYTIEMKEKHIKETELEAEAEKVKREKTAQAAALEQVIAAKAQEDAMKHILPFKERQIKQRELEAEADKQSRIRGAEAGAKSREIEAVGEANARQKLADAEVYRLDRVGKASSEQMEREGALITKHPLLIQKAMADKLSDKIQVIIAPPNTGNGFIGANLIGQGNANPPPVAAAPTPVSQAQYQNEEE